MYCAICGEALKPAYMGAYYQCHRNMGYWSNCPPEAGIRLPKYKGYYLYLNHEIFPMFGKVKRPKL